MKLIDIYRHVLKEYITTDGVRLLRYFQTSEEERKEYLPLEYNFVFREDKYKDRIFNDIPDEIADAIEEFVDLDESTMKYLRENERDTYDVIADWLYKHITNFNLPISIIYYPAWSFFESPPEVVKRQWLIHFTDEARSITNNGFTKGVDKIDRLGVTVKLADIDKKYGGFNFAYLLSDIEKYAVRQKYEGGQTGKYGEEAVVFNASGVKVWHTGDKEPQVIFYGSTARNIIPITSGREAEWAVYNIDSGRLLYESDDIKNVVDWIVNNYQQYRGVLHK